MGSCFSDDKANISESSTRRRMMREQYLREQAEWRERRLRQVVRVLVDRGEADEGIALAFQLPNRPEVLARRQLRNLRAAQRARLELVDDQDDPRLDEEGRATVRRTLDELLANGRPQDSEPGPDVMQLLLEGQEVRPRGSSDEDENSNEFVQLAPSPAPPAHTPYSSQSGTITTRNQQQREGLGSQPVGTGSAARPSNASSTDGGNGASPLPETREAQRMRREQEERARHEEAIIKELHEESNPTRRRKTADELYGPGIPYVKNPNNEDLARSMEESARNGTSRGGGGGDHTHREHEPQSALMRFLSPLTPWRGKKRRAKTSAFESREPTEAGGSNSVASPLKPPQHHSRSPFEQTLDQFINGGSQREAPL